MRLTHIKLAGFKSFVDPTTLHVPGQLVAVMGPNGCGKSNVIDAVRWVLGEASAKQLRGESMQDVIFNGAATRKAVSRAAVELVFDNADGRLQGAWGQYAEIAIKRTLTRQGESHYYINNQLVRRRDITDLFLGTGVGARGYAVIEQGMIARIIEARPEELRAYIEEAAGVSKYKDRRKETASRLKDTREHLQRLADIQSELERQISKLSRQAEAAERYQQLKQQLNWQQDLADFVRWQHADTALQHASELQHTLHSQLEHAETEAQHLSEQHYRLQLDEQIVQQGLNSLTEQRSTVREQAARLEEQIQHFTISRERALREQQQAQQQLHLIEQERQRLQDAMTELLAQLDELQLNHEQWQLQLEQLQHTQPEHDAAADQLNQAWQNQQATQHRLERELALVQQQLVHHDARSSEWQQRQELLRAELTALALPEATTLQAAHQRVHALQQQLLELENILDGHDEQAQQLQDAWSEQQRHEQQLQQQVLQLQAKHQAISALLPTEQQPDLWGEQEPLLLWQHLDIAPQWRYAVQTVLRERLYCHAQAPLTLPKQQNAVWLTPSTSPTNTSPLTNDGLLQYIRSDSVFECAMQWWFGHFRCAENLEQALRRQDELKAGQCWITPQADIVDAVSVQCSDGGQDLALQHQAEVNELASQIAQLLPQQQQAQQHLDAVQQHMQQQQQQYKQCQQQHKQLHAQWRDANTEATQLLERTQQGQLRHEHIQQELAQLAEQLSHSTAQQQQQRQQQQQLMAAKQALTHDFAQLDVEREAMQERIKHVRLQVLETQRQQGLVALDVQKNQQSLHHHRQRLQQLTEQEAQWQQRQQSLALQFDDEANCQQLQLTWEHLHTQLEGLEERIASEQQQLQTLQQQRQTLQQQQQQLDVRLPQWRAELQQQLLAQQQAQMNKQRYGEQLQQRHANWQALRDNGDVDEQQLQSHIAKLSQRIQALGAVNLAALDELTEARERFDYYHHQRSDVQQAMDALHEAIAQIDNETKALFEQTFDAVNAHMQNFFPTLFGGGEASLRLLGDDLLDAGVAIMARPPGKKNATIHLLSGGEKALTAMALVFALFSLNPAPFCLLDEVDAPLDDANTGRFCRLVEQMSAQTQFLYISHNRLTMEMAEQLIGVTMQEQGVSRIVEVDIKQALALAAQ